MRGGSGLAAGRNGTGGGGGGPPEIDNDERGEASPLNSAERIAIGRCNS